MRKPIPLASGATARIVAPSGPFDPARLVPGIRFLEGLGLKVEVPERIFHREGFLAGPDQERADEFAASLEPGAAVIAARGGYGAMRILDALDDRAGSLPPGLVVGFSDITALHLFFLGRGNLVTFHGPNGVSLSSSCAETRNRMAAMLFGLSPEATFRYEGLTPRVGGRAAGRIVAGNLSLFCALVGTRHAAPLAGAILVIEEVNEPAYRVDRMLTQLLMLSDIGAVAGVAFGELGVPPEERDWLEASLARFCDRLGRPVVTGFPIGHGPVNHPVPEGVRAELDADRGILRVVEDPFDRGMAS